MKLITLEQLSTTKETILKDKIKLIEELFQKNIKTWNEKISREFLESVNATKISEIELNCSIDIPIPMSGIVLNTLMERLEKELKESGFQFNRTERNSFRIKNPFFENIEVSYNTFPPPGHFEDKQPVRVVAA